MFSYPADPAALFMQLYDQLPEQVFRERQPKQWQRDRWVKGNASRVYEHILEHGAADPGQVKKIIEEGGDRGIFAVLRGIDWALALVNPFSAGYESGNLAWLETRYAETGQLNDGPATEGVLLPRCAYPGRPGGSSGKALYFGLHRVAPECWARIRYERLKNRHDPNFGHDQPVIVGCAPLLESFADVQLEVLKRDGEQVFSLTPNDSEVLRERISNVIRRLDESEAPIGIMPEGTLTDDLLAYWRKAAREPKALGKPLRWVLVGSGPLGADDPPPNRAVLLDRRTGDILLTQDKLAGFTLTPEQTRDWKLPDQLDSGPAAEYLAQGSTITVLESSLGRLAVLICEDLNQSVGWERELIACGISHLLIPIFSKPIMRYRWEQTGSERQINNMGAWLIIANSLAVKQAMGESLQNGDCHTCLVAGPGDPERSSYSYDLQFGVAKAGDELGQILFDGVLALPVIRTGALRDEWFGDDRGVTTFGPV